MTPEECVGKYHHHQSQIAMNRRLLNQRGLRTCVIKRTAPPCEKILGPSFFKDTSHSAGPSIP
jgi:hypothetical protein